METSSIVWISLGLIFVLFIAASIVIYVNAKQNIPLVDSIYSKHASEKTSYWKVVKGKVIDNALDYRDHKRLFAKTIRQYRSRITYEYFAYDRKYHHTTPIINWTNNKEDATQALDKHKVECEIVVRFHPKQPETSIVELNN